MLLRTRRPLGHVLVRVHVGIAGHGEPELARIEVPSGIEVVLGAGAEQDARPSLIWRIEHMRAAFEEADAMPRVVDGECREEDEPFVPLRDGDDVAHLVVRHRAFQDLQLQPRRLGQHHVPDHERHIKTTTDNHVEAAVLRAVRALDRDADARSERNLEVVEPRRVRAVPEPFGSPRRGRVVKARARGHPGLVDDGGVLLAIDVVAHSQRALALRVAGRPEVVHLARVPRRDLVREERLLPCVECAPRAGGAESLGDGRRG